MTDTPDLVVLLYRADWTRLSLAAEVSRTVDLDLSALRSEPDVPRARSGNEWETATDLQGTETTRSTLLVAPGRRYRYQGEGFIDGSDGDRSWHEVEDDGAWVATLTTDPEGSGPPLRTLLRPTWLLTGFALEIGGPVTACGREALRVVATPQRSMSDSMRWREPRGREPLDRVEVIVDAELGILLRHEEIFQGQALSLTELVSVSFDPAQAADDAQFQPPSGWAAAEKNAKPTPPDVLDSDLVKLTMVLMAGGLGALIKPSSSDPFGQATREEPGTAMPEDEPFPPGALPVSDEVLHLLHAGQDRQEPGIEATLHCWQDITALLSRAPDRVRRAGLGRIGSLVDAAGQRIPPEHTVTHLRIAGPDRYRIDEVAGPKARARPVTTVCDGERRWSIFADKVKVGAPAPPRGEIANLLDPSWLLEARLTGGTETVIGGRRGYRLAAAPDYPHRIPMYSPDEVVVDGELGVLLGWITHLGPRTLMRYELRDITAYSGEPGDFQPDLPPGIRVIEEDPDDGVTPGPGDTPSAMAGFFARQAAKDARSAVQGFVDFIRGGDARLPQDDADDLAGEDDEASPRLATIMCGEPRGTTGENMDLDRRLDPEIAAALAELPIMDLSDIPAAREIMLERRAAAAADAAPSPTVVRQDHLVPGLNGAPDVRVRHYRPIRAPGVLPCLYWIHGGGHVLGQVDQDDLVMDHIVDTVGCAAVSVEWRRAPEHPFPAPMDDCYAGLAWTHKHAAELNVDPQRIAVGGASSGGGSAAGLVLLARDRGEFPVCFQLLIYPMLDDRNATPASMALTDPRVWNRTSNLIGWRAYVGDAAGTDRVSPYAAPARAANLAGLPPAYLAVGDLDLFIDEDIEYAQRLQQAAVPTELHVYPGGSHAFETYAPGSALARRFVRDRDEALRRAFGF